jgi:hypothetical protein
MYFMYFMYLYMNLVQSFENLSIKNINCTYCNSTCTNDKITKCDYCNKKICNDCINRYNIIFNICDMCGSSICYSYNCPDKWYLHNEVCKYDMCKECKYYL